MGVEGSSLSWLWNDTALALGALGQHKEAIAVHELVLDIDIDLDDPGGVLRSLRNIALATDMPCSSTQSNASTNWWPGRR